MSKTINKIQSRTHAIQAVLFDCDGCLVDTAPDMAGALNAVRAEENLPPLAYERIRPVVSHGGAGLIKLGFDLQPGDTHFDRLRERFLTLYQNGLVKDTQLFLGFETLLAELESRQLTWGIITNKPAWLTDPLVAELGLSSRAACVVSGDTTAHSKPHPAPMNYACEQIQIAPEHCLYLGDAERDIQAGNAVGMTTVAVNWGYLSVDDDPTLWQADHIIDTPQQILTLL